MTTIARGPSTYDLIIVGGSAGGMSVAISSLRSGLERVRVIESDDAVAFPELVGENRLDIGFGETVTSIDVVESDLVLTSDKLAYRTRAVLIADRASVADWQVPVPVSISNDVTVDVIEAATNDDILVVGHTDHAVELAATAAAAGASVVLAAGGMDPARLSPAGDHMLRRLERERRATLLYRSVPVEIGDLDGHPMAYFGDRRTPDLQFDRVVFSSPRRTLTPQEVGATEAAVASGRVWFLGETDAEGTPPTAPGWRIGPELAQACFPEVETVSLPDPLAVRSRHVGEIEELRAEHYNATITHFEPTHSDLWVLRVRPDKGDVSHLPGQYASLGLGYWEARIDDAVDPAIEDRWGKLIRRSYSISSPIFDPSGYLFDPRAGDELEFYIVLVRPTADNVPALTPRLALLRPGDRVYMGPKVAGRYTLTAVTDPSMTVVLLSTGTGEAPHNAMVLELLRKGHIGPIVSAVSVRQWSDLGYRAHHDRLAERYPNYHYLPLPTRESDVPKRYIQDVITDGSIESLGATLDPANTHVYLCGNPAMIGLAEVIDGAEVYPSPPGVVELLVERGFTLDRRDQPGNIHVEEYW